MAAKPIPDGHSTVIPYLVVPDVAGLIEFIQKTFGAKEMYRTTMANGAIMHAHVHIAESSIMMGQAPPDYKATQGMLYVYVTDVDAVYRRALEAGGTSINAPADQFYGDRVAAVKDPSGNQWWIATHKEDVPEDEIARRAAAARGGK